MRNRILANSATEQEAAKTWERIMRMMVLLSAMLPLSLTGCHWMGAYSPLGPLERKLVYHPQVYPDGDWTLPTPDTEEVWFENPDGTQLHGWFLPHPAPRAVALVCHGNAGSIAGLQASLVRLNQRHELAVMAFDYRGFGRSKGKPSETGLLADARAARDWLARRTDIGKDDIVLMGYSLGGGVAVDLAAKDGASGLVLWSTFSNLPQTAAHHYSWLPTNLLMTQRFDSLAKIENYHGPLLQSHGDADTVIPIELGQRLHQQHRGPKQFITIPGTGHLDADSEEYQIALSEFLKQLEPSVHLTGHATVGP
jgi:fermentation-respiration switch protein FrsA (DUF1100 family)